MIQSYGSSTSTQARSTRTAEMIQEGMCAEMRAALRPSQPAFASFRQRSHGLTDSRTGELRRTRTAVKGNTFAVRHGAAITLQPQYSRILVRLACNLADRLPDYDPSRPTPSISSKRRDFVGGPARSLLMRSLQNHGWTLMCVLSTLTKNRTFSGDKKCDAIFPRLLCSCELH